MTKEIRSPKSEFVIRHSSFVIPLLQSLIPIPFPLMFDPSDDLSTVADGTETVTLLRRGRTPGDEGTVIAHALETSHHRG